MRTALYVRVSTPNQVLAQTIENQLTQLRQYSSQQWDLSDDYIFRDEGYSGARLNRPGLDRAC